MFAEDSHLYWLLATALLLLLTYGMGRRAMNAISRTLGRLEEVTAESSREIRELLDEQLSPSIHVHDGPMPVARRLAEIVVEAADEEQPEDRHITLYGAASISTHSIGEDPSGKTPAEIYSRAISHAVRQQVRMRRYIRLFAEDEFRERGEEVREQYLGWLRSQYEQLQKDENYQLADVVRALQWGANMARVITTEAVLEITGNGRAAIAVRDRQIAETIRLYAREAVLGRHPRNEPIFYGIAADARNLSDFKRYIERIEALDRSLAA